MKELAGLDCVAEATNIPMLGAPGVGKTRLAVALAKKAIERGSITLTYNKGFGEWGELLGDTVIASAELDRLLRHSHVVNMEGDSYRLREKRQAPLFPSQQFLSPPTEGTNENAGARLIHSLSFMHQLDSLLPSPTNSMRWQ